MNKYILLSLLTISSLNFLSASPEVSVSLTGSPAELAAEAARAGGLFGNIASSNNGSSIATVSLPTINAAYALPPLASVLLSSAGVVSIAAGLKRIADYLYDQTGDPEKQRLSLIEGCAGTALGSAAIIAAAATLNAVQK